MQDLVDRLSAELSNKYLTYIETFMVDLWSEDGFIEFRCGFTLRSDHVLKSLVVRCQPQQEPAMPSVTS